MHEFVQILNPKVFFWANLIPKTEVSPNWLKSGTNIHCFILVSNLMLFFKVFFFSLIFLGKFRPKIWSYIQGILLNVYHNSSIYFCKIFVIHSFLDIFGSNLVPNSLIVNIFFCITILIRASSRNSLHNTVVESVRFAPLWNSKIYSIIETNKYYLHNYKLIKN